MCLELSRYDRNKTVPFVEYATGSSALHAPFHHLWLVDFGLVEKDLLCAIMTIIAGVDLGSL